MKFSYLLATAAVIAAPALAQTPLADLAKPPADAKHFIIESTGGKHGDSYIWTTADGTRMSRESMNLRGQVFEQDAAVTTGADGMPAKIIIRGYTPNGDAGESFAVTDGTASWTSQIDKGSASYKRPAFYASQGGPVAINGWLVEALLASPDHSLSLLPGGSAHVEKLTTAEVGEGASKQTVTLWAVTGIGNTPFPVWADASNKFFGATLGLNWLPEAYAKEDRKLEKVQAVAMAAQAPALVKSLVHVPAGPVAFVGVKMFDADGLKFLANQTIVVNKGVIVAVGPASKVKAPAGAQIIAGKGMTLVPGMWDCHMHVGDDYTGPQELSLGVTSVRDPGNNDALTIDRRTRARPRANCCSRTFMRRR